MMMIMLWLMSMLQQIQLLMIVDDELMIFELMIFVQMTAFLILVVKRVHQLVTPALSLYGQKTPL